MTLLLDIPESPLPPLEQARRDYEAACLEVERIENDEEGLAELAYGGEARRKRDAYLARVRALEGEALRRAGK